MQVRIGHPLNDSEFERAWGAMDADKSGSVTPPGLQKWMGTLSSHDASKLLSGEGATTAQQDEAAATDAKPPGVLLKAAACLKELDHYLRVAFPVAFLIYVIVMHARHGVGEYE
eukprot:COSAG01_NODE_6939_length_3431_cov_3.279712_2_plen_114_part_00